jgi:hypothetical protein
MKKANALIIPSEYKSNEPFKLPFAPLGDRVVDADERQVCQIEAEDPQEAIKIARLFASSVESLNRLNSVAMMLEASLKGTPEYKHGDLDEDIDNCLICYIQHYVKEVLS